MTTTPMINLHIIQSVPASLFNRDENSSAKAITIGGVRRDRVSSQSWKRAMRLALREKLQAGTLEDGTWGVRTNRLPRQVADKLTETGHDYDIALAKTLALFTAMGLKVSDKKPQTASQLYIAADAADHLAQLVGDNFDAIGDKIDTTITDAALACLDPDRAVDIALFGRFMSELKTNKRLDGAVGVSHAFGVTPSTVEMDFWTAVDDIQNDDDTASSNLGYTDLTAPVFYRHLFLDRGLLTANISGTALNPTEIETHFLRIAATASPAAKQNSTAANTLPAVIIATAGTGNYSAADAFTTPITSTTTLADATTALHQRLASFSQLGITDKIVALPLTPEATTALADTDAHTVDTLDALIDAIQD